MYVYKCIYIYINIYIYIHIYIYVYTYTPGDYIQLSNVQKLHYHSWKKKLTTALIDGSIELCLAQLSERGLSLSSVRLLLSVLCCYCTRRGLSAHLDSPCIQLILPCVYVTDDVTISLWLWPDRH